MYPGTKHFAAVEADKTAFPLSMPPSPKGKTASKNLTEDLNYDDMFKLRNMGAVRHSFMPGKMSLSSLQHESHLRVIKSKPMIAEKVTVPRVPLKFRKEAGSSSLKVIEE
jgi:hypothetical protein